jgi:hypothetical protein
MSAEAMCSTPQHSERFIVHLSIDHFLKGTNGFPDLQYWYFVIDSKLWTHSMDAMSAP